ncbi:acetyltransferase, GNAT family [Piromyces finnis]|uniref:Acetyltransferase, GNAT family n=1 Tax=Piromyces finnis TaxID=1754191 RepID=A0A1Y1V084_9FUNG|nr:acetyltransferase, GNAT family [Piromyces finnis]|eukprot:ORX44501.1 acetyltransferase, GNAT family [Piromyces finnis]
MSSIKIRKATVKDAESIQKIYKYYVEKTAITFEIKVPTVNEFRLRMEEKMNNGFQKYPYIVAEENDEVIGYAYTSPFIGREAYNWSAVTTIYLKNNAIKKGLGRRLYEVIENISKVQNITNLYACIGYPEKEDEYLTNNSKDFHEHLGYRLVGLFNKCGYKFNCWYHMVWMEKILNEHKSIPDPVIPFSELSSKKLLELGLVE